MAERSPQPLTLAWFLHDAVVFRGTSWLDSPLWSLQWEVLFGVPALAVVGASRRPRLAAVQGAVLLVAIALGVRTGHQGLVYFPMFGIGALMARHAALLRRFAERLATRHFVALTIAAVLLVTSSWTLGPSDASWSMPGVTAGAALLVYLFAFWRPLAAAAEGRRLQWLGKRSFSLYLVHEPIVVSVALLLGGSANAGLTLLVALPLSLGAAHLFTSAAEVRATAPRKRSAARSNRGLRRPRALRPCSRALNPGCARSALRA